MIFLDDRHYIYHVSTRVYRICDLLFVFLCSTYNDVNNEIFYVFYIYCVYIHGGLININNTIHRFYSLFHCLVWKENRRIFIIFSFENTRVSFAMDEDKSKIRDSTFFFFFLSSLIVFERLSWTSLFYYFFSILLSYSRIEM